MCTDCSFPRRRRAGPGQTSPLPRPIEVAPGLGIYPREAWAGTTRPPTGELYPESVYFLLVHHSLGPEPRSKSDPIAEMQEIYDYHTGPTVDWPDVAYNFFIDQFGRVFEARSGSLKGPVMANAIGGSQGFGQLVCVLGDYTKALPTADAQDSLKKTLAWLADRHDLEIGPEAEATFDSRGSNRWPEGSEVTVNTISGHRDVSDTACPGDALYRVVHNELPTLVADKRSGGAGTVSPSTIEPSNSGPSTVAEVTAADSTTPATEAASSTTTATTGTTSTTTSTTSTTTISTTTEPTTTEPATTAASTAPATVPQSPRFGRSGPWGVFVTGAVGGTAAVAVVGGLAWVINRRRENARNSEW